MEGFVGGQGRGGLDDGGGVGGRGSVVGHAACAILFGDADDQEGEADDLGDAEQEQRRGKDLGGAAVFGGDESDGDEGPSDGDHEGGELPEDPTCGGGDGMAEEADDEGGAVACGEGDDASAQEAVHASRRVTSAVVLIPLVTRLAWLVVGSRIGIRWGILWLCGAGWLCGLCGLCALGGGEGADLGALDVEGALRRAKDDDVGIHSDDGAEEDGAIFEDDFLLLCGVGMGAKATEGEEREQENKGPSRKHRRLLVFSKLVGDGSGQAQDTMAMVNSQEQRLRGR